MTLKEIAIGSLKYAAGATIGCVLANLMLVDGPAGPWNVAIVALVALPVLFFFFFAVFYFARH